MVLQSVLVLLQFNFYFNDHLSKVNLCTTQSQDYGGGQNKNSNLSWLIREESEKRAKIKFIQIYGITRRKNCTTVN